MIPFSGRVLFATALTAAAIGGLFVASGAGEGAGYFAGLALFGLSILGVFGVIATAWGSSPIARLSPFPSNGVLRWAIGGIVGVAGIFGLFFAGAADIDVDHLAGADGEGAPDVAALAGGRPHALPVAVSSLGAPGLHGELGEDGGLLRQVPDPVALREGSCPASPVLSMLSVSFHLLLRLLAVLDTHATAI